ncbi:MAG: hypothetical protein JOZ41_11010 [Chloroflexi bacterium]|nr:hypothetical protein [Chloroflexota bacterium]
MKRLFSMVIVVVGMVAAMAPSHRLLADISPCMSCGSSLVTQDAATPGTVSSFSS